MNAENTRKLLEKFPHLYREYHLPMTETCMCWGFEHGDGWFQILWDLSEKIGKLLETKTLEQKSLFAVDQVKEKYGTLRFYYHGWGGCFEEIEPLVEEAEALSAQTCEYCGKPGMTREAGWLVTLCDSCQESRSACK
jgi:hypothetical protein